MELDRQLERLAPLIETLVDAPDAGQRHRLILDGVRTAGIAEGGCLWSESGEDGEFDLIASDGDQGCAPSATQIWAVARGDLDGRLPHRQTVIIAGRAPTRIALSMCELVDVEVWEDILEAVLVLAWQLNSPWPVEEPLDLIDTLLAPFQQDLGMIEGGMSAEIDSILSLMQDDLDEDEDEADEETAA